MTSAAADLSECLTTEAPCLVCVMTLGLDDDRPKIGTVRWKIVPDVRLKIGTAVNFECPNGHSTENDPELLKGFPPRRFW